MPTLSVRQIAEIVQGELKPSLDDDVYLISSIAIDSRTIFDPELSLFFALKSERNDGQRYIPDLVHIGVRAFVVSDYSEELRKYENCCLVVYPYTLKA